MPALGFLKFRISTGTGFAQPKRNSAIMISPIKSTCLSGLRLSRPIRFAVLSPSLYAAKP